MPLPRLLALASMVIVLGCSRNAALPRLDASVDRTAPTDTSPDSARDTGGEAEDTSPDLARDTGGEAEAIDGASSCSGPIDFRLEAADQSAWFAFDSEQDCGGNWLSILDAAGKEVQIGQPTLHCCTQLSCRSCQPDVFCPAAFTDSSLPATRTWNTTFFAAGTCGGQPCLDDSSCAPGGHYVARMCASRDRNHAGAMTCVDVPFDLPTSGTIVGTLPAS